jgi:hypothetical protein
MIGRRPTAGGSPHLRRLRTGSMRFAAHEQKWRKWHAIFAHDRVPSPCELRPLHRPPHPGGQGPGRTLSRPIVASRCLGIVIGMAVMILTVGITHGFQREVRAKVTGAGGHLQITAIGPDRPERNAQSGDRPVLLSVAGYRARYRPYPSAFATNPGIIETDRRDRRCQC